MTIERYIIVQAIQIKENEFIPIWDNRLIFDGEIESYESIILDGTRYTSVVECIYDLETKNLTLGTELNYYSESKDFKIGDSVYYEVTSKKLAESKIWDIVYEECDLNIFRGEDKDYWVEKYFSNINFENSMLYCIKTWKPVYILENGVKIKHYYKLFNKA